MPTSTIHSSAGVHAGVSRREALRFLGLAGVSAALAGGRLSSSEPLPNGDLASVGATPSPAGLMQPAFYRFKIGALDAIAINDGGMLLPVAQSPFGVGEPVEAKVAVLRDAFLTITQVNMQFNVLLVRFGSQLALFDTGYGSLAGKAAGRLPAQLAAAGVTPDQINAVFLTHAHGDHFGGLLDANGEVVFKNATHYVGRKEFEFWTAANPDVSHLRQTEDGRRGMVEGARGILEKLRAKFQLIAGGDKLIDGLEIIDAPGHTPGHLAFLISSGGDQLLHIVDAAHHHAFSFSKPEWILLYDVQPELAEATRRKLFDRAAADRLRVFGAHLAFPSLGHVKALPQRRYEFVIAPWVVS